MRGATVEVKCQRCKEPFTARVADRKRGWGKFCSKSCKAIKQSHSIGNPITNYRGSGVSMETYIEYQTEYGGQPQFNRKGEYEGFCGIDHEHDCNKE